MSHAPASGLDTADADTGPALAFGTESPSRRLAKSGSCRLPQSPLTRLSQLTHGPRPVPVRSHSQELRNSTEDKRENEPRPGRRKAAGRSTSGSVRPVARPPAVPATERGQTRDSVAA